VADEDLLAGDPVAFASNTLVLVTPADNPAGVDDVADLASDDVDAALCVPQAPCGAATQRLLELNHLTVAPVTQEDNVRSVLTKVRLDQVDAGIVYVSDATAAGDDVQTVPIPRSADVVNVNPIAVVAGSDEPDAARDWVDLVLSADGQQTLAEYGFGTVS
jgi:molybdate transport system substrate-binding protein